MSVHCLFCSSRKWENCIKCSYSEKVDKNTLYLVPSGIFIKKGHDDKIFFKVDSND